MTLAGWWILPQLKRIALPVGLALSTLAALPGPAAAAGDWPVFGHDLANSRNAAGDGPSEREAAALRRLWTFSSSHGDFTGTPVVADGTVVAGTNLGWVFALNARTGRVRWSRDIGHPINGSAAIDVRAPGAPTVFIPVARVGDPRLVALSLRGGGLRWNVPLSHQSGSDVFGSPTFWRGTVFIGTCGPGNDESTARGSVVAVSERTGRLRWRTYTVPPHHDGGAVWSTPSIDPSTDRLYVGTGNAYHAPAARTTDSILALSASNGRILGHFQSTASDVWELNAPAGGPDYDFGASPNLFVGDRGRRLVGEGQKSGTYWALNPRTMRPVWRASVGPGSQADGGIGSSGVSDGVIYGSDSADSQVFALTRRGRTRWNELDGGTLHISPVALGHGLLYSIDSTAGLLVIRRAADGRVINRLSIGGPSFGGISLAGRSAYVAVGTGPPSPLLPLPSSSTQGADGNGSIIAFGNPSAPGQGGRFRLRFSSQTPGRGTGAHLEATVARRSPQGEPAALRSEVLTLPSGARFDGGAVTACHATNQELQALGPRACPAQSRVGAGTLQVDMGTPLDPETADVAIFNWGQGTVEVLTAPGTGVTLAIDRGEFTGPGQLTNHPPQAPGGPPDFRAAVRSANFVYRDTTSRGRAFITTPSRCPSSGAWTSRIEYSTADGRTYHARSATPCRQ